MNKIKKIVIVGNGFDIDHGLKTSYTEILGNNDTWIKMSRAMGKMASIFEKTKVEWNNYESAIEEVVLTYQSIFRRKVKLSDESKYERESLEDTFKLFLSHIHNRGVDISNRESINQELENWNSNKVQQDFSTALIYILKNGIIKAIENEPGVISPKYLKYFIDDPQIINFNYTNLWEKGLNSIHVHGKITKETKITPDTEEKWGSTWLPKDIIKVGYTSLTVNQGVLGNPEPSLLSNDYYDENASLIVLDVFEEYIGNKNTFLNKDSSNIQWERVKELKIEDNYELTFLGHSLNKIDMDLLDHFLFKKGSESKPHKVTIVGYYKAKEDIDKVDNAIRRAFPNDYLNVEIVNNFKG